MQRCLITQRELGLNFEFEETGARRESTNCHRRNVISLGEREGGGRASLAGWFVLLFVECIQAVSIHCRAHDSGKADGKSGLETDNRLQTASKCRLGNKSRDLRWKRW